MLKKTFLLLAWDLFPIFLWCSIVSVSCLGQTKEQFDKALNVVVFFETARSAHDLEAWGTITPDFDKNGISAGAIQFNVGKNTLQPLIRKIGKEKTLEYMHNYGQEFWQAMSSAPSKTLVKQAYCKNNQLRTKDVEVSNALQYARSLQNIVVTCVNEKEKRRATWKPDNKDFPAELANLLSSPIGQEKQRELALENYGIAAWKDCLEWIKSTRGEQSKPTAREFTTFLDNQIFGGGLKGLNFAKLQDFKSTTKSTNLKDDILMWLASGKDPNYQVIEARKNSKLWNDRINQDNLDFFTFWYLRALDSVGDGGKFKWNVLSRRGTIMFNDGYVNGHRKSFEELKEN